MSILKVNHVSKSYNGVLALDDVSLSVEANQAYGFIGRNGAGKTTMINIILSLLTKNDGDIVFNDAIISQTDIEYKNYIGYVPDVPSFPTYLTAYEFLSFAYDSYNLDKEHRQSAIEQVLLDVGLENSKKKIGQYSRGMKQRLAIAGALMHKPILLIMDEPTSALDPIGRKAILDIIGRLKKTMAIFYSTHILEDAQKVCDRIGLIDQGKLILEDSMDALMNRVDTQSVFIETGDNKQTMDMLKGCSFTEAERFYQSGVLYRVKDGVREGKVLQYLMDNDVDIVALNKQKKTLEDVFIEVLNENDN